MYKSMKANTYVQSATMSPTEYTLEHSRVKAARYTPMLYDTVTLVTGIPKL